MSTEIEESLRRIHGAHKSVVGVIVVNSEGATIRSTVPGAGQSGSSSASTPIGAPSDPSADQSKTWAGIIATIVDRARMAFKENDELQFLKIRTKRNEFIVVPDKDFMMITVLNPNNESSA